MGPRLTVGPKSGHPFDARLADAATAAGLVVASPS